MRINSPAGAAPIPSKAQLLLQLAERCEREEPSARLDEAIEFATQTSIRSCPVPYATSLDAAVTLVPEGQSFVLRDIRGHMSQASVFPHFTLPGVDASARTLALALCAATLRARAALLSEAEGIDETGEQVLASSPANTPSSRGGRVSKK